MSSTVSARGSEPTPRKRGADRPDHRLDPMSDEKSRLTLRSGENGDAVGGSFWLEVGGRATFERLVRAFYARRCDG